MCCREEQGECRMRRVILSEPGCHGKSHDTALMASGHKVVAWKMKENQTEF